MKHKTLAILLSLALPSLAFAWHNEGHMTVAAIAWDQMTAQARTKAITLLNSAPPDSGIAALRPTTGTAQERDRMQFIRAATWSDAVRNGPRKARYHQGSWHFTDFFWEQLQPGGPKRQRADLPTEGDLVKKLPALEASLRRTDAPSISPSKGTDLAWFLHLMGDIAQPLHASGRITALPLDAHGDHGGNFFCLRAGQEADGECRDNLHAYWDDVIEREFGNPVNIVQLAANLENAAPRSARNPGGLGNYEGWARTSQRIAFAEAYPATLVRNQAVPPAYRDLVKRICVKTITLAGFRLGATLNNALGR